jgi:NitT/TauT family transport system substrate-binding protein
MKKLAFNTFCIIFCLFLFSCQNGISATGKVSESTKKTLKIGLVTWIGYGPFYIAKEKGFFNENGIEVKLERIEGDAERRAAIASGRLDGSCLTVDSVVVLRSRGVSVKIAMAIDSSNGGDGIVAIKDIKNIKNLKGKQIAFPTGQPSHLFLYSVLKENGIKMSDVKPIVMDADKAGAAFAAGRVEVAVTWEPWLSKAREMVNGHILIDSKQHHGDIEDVLFMREEIIANRPDDIKAFIKAWYKAVDFVESNPDEAKSIIGKAFGLTKEKVTELLPKVIYEGKDRNQKAFGTKANPGFIYKLYDKISEAWLTEKIIDKRDKPEDGIYPDFIRSIK